MFSPALVAAFAALAFAAPPTVPFTTQKYVDTFPNTNAVLPLLPLLSSVGNTANEGGLQYRAWEYATPSTLVIRPASPPNIIVSGAVAQLREGEPAFFPKNPRTLCFDLTSICFKCFVNAQNSLVSATTPCTIQLTGQTAYGPNPGSSVVTQLVTNDLSVGGDMVCQTLSKDFNCLKNVDVDVIQAATTTSPLLLAPGLDNVAYTVYNKKD